MVLFGSTKVRVTGAPATASPSTKVAMGAVLANAYEHLPVAKINSSSNCAAEGKPSWKGQELYFALIQSKKQAHDSKQDYLSSTTLRKPAL